MQVVPKWKITIVYASREAMVFWMYDNHPGNVLRKVADLQFSENGLEQPTAVRIEQVA